MGKRQSRIVGLVIVPVALLMVLLVRVNVPAQASPRDVLVYVTYGPDIDRVMRYDVHTKVAKTLISTDLTIAGSNRTPQQPEISTDGRVAFTNGSVYVWENGVQTNLGKGWDIDWSEDNRLAFKTGTDTNYQIMVWEDGTLTNVGQRTSGFTFDEQGLVYLRKDGTITTNKGRNENNVDYIYDAVWNADGKIALGSVHEGNWDIYVWDNQTLTNITQSPEYDRYPSWSVDNRLVFTSENGIAIWDNGIISHVAVPAPPDSYVIDPQLMPTVQILRPLLNTSDTKYGPAIVELFQRRSGSA
jgi:hypothetical protein